MPLHRLALKSIAAIGVIDNPEFVLRGPYSISPRRTAMTKKKGKHRIERSRTRTEPISPLVTLTKDHPFVIVLLPPKETPLCER